MPVHSNTGTAKTGSGNVDIDITLADDGSSGLGDIRTFDVVLTVEDASALALAGSINDPQGKGFITDGNSVRWLDLEIDVTASPAQTVDLQCKLKFCDSMSEPACIVVVVAEHADDRRFKVEWIPIAPCTIAFSLSDRQLMADPRARLRQLTTLLLAGDDSDDD